jgi:hypothetical protein
MNTYLHHTVVMARLADFGRAAEFERTHARPRADRASRRGRTARGLRRRILRPAA